MALGPDLLHPVTILPTAQESSGVATSSWSQFPTAVLLDYHIGTPKMPIKLKD